LIRFPVDLPSYIMTVVGTVGSAELACSSTAGKWRRSSSWANYAGRGTGKATYVKGDIRQGLMKKFSSRKIGETARVPTNENKLHTSAACKSLVSTTTTTTTLASTAPSSGLTGTCTTMRPSDLSSVVCLSDFSIDGCPDLISSVQLVDGEMKTESVRFEIVDATDLDSESPPLVDLQLMEKTVEQAEVSERLDETGAVVSEEQLRRKQGVKLLFSSTAAHMFALQLAMPASQSIWLNHFDGDFAAQAANTSNLMSSALVAGVFVNPIIAGTSDVVGRKPVVVGGLAISALGKALCAVRPGASALRVQTVMVMPLAMAHTLGVQTALGDLFAGDGKGFGAAQAQMLLATTIPGLVCPLIGASLTQRFGPSVPFALAGIVEAGACLMDSKLLRETQPKEERKPLVLQSALKSVNPLAFLELFRHGPRLSLLAVMRMLNFACDKSNLMQVSEVYRNQVLGLTLQENALYMMSAFAVAAPSFALAGPLLQKFGTSACLRVGLCMRTVESLILSSATSLSIFKAVLPLGITGAAASTSVSAMLQDEATRMKLNQGEFQGCLSSLNTVTQVMVTLLWARLYAFGARRGKPGMYLQVIAMICGLQMLLERILSKTGSSTCSARECSARECGARHCLVIRKQKVSIASMSWF